MNGFKCMQGVWIPNDLKLLFTTQEQVSSGICKYLSILFRLQATYPLPPIQTWLTASVLNLLLYTLQNFFSFCFNFCIFILKMMKVRVFILNSNTFCFKKSSYKVIDDKLQ